MPVGVNAGVSMVGARTFDGQTIWATDVWVGGLRWPFG